MNLDPDVVLNELCSGLSTELSGSLYTGDRFLLEVYRRTALELLCRSPITNTSARLIAKLYFVGHRTPTVMAILLDHSLRAKDIVMLSEGFRPVYSTLSAVTAKYSLRRGARRCIIAANFLLDMRISDILDNIDLMYEKLEKLNVLLVDFIIMLDDDAVSFVHPINPDGYTPKLSSRKKKTDKHIQNK